MGREGRFHEYFAREPEQVAAGAEGNVLVDLRRCLEVQKLIFDEAA